MHYSLIHGIYTPLHDRLARIGGTLAPLAAAVFLALALGTASVFEASGKHPQLSTSTGGTNSNVAATRSGAGTQVSSSATNSGPAQAASGGSNTTSLAPTGTTAPLSGGYGGGDLGSTVPTGTSSSGLPPSDTTTVTVPGQDLSAGGKDIISTNPLSLTLN